MGCSSFLLSALRRQIRIRKVLFRTEILISDLLRRLEAIDRLPPFNRIAGKGSFALSPRLCYAAMGAYLSEPMTLIMNP